MDNPPHLRGVVVMKGLSYQPYVYNQDNTLRRTLPDTLYRLDCQVASPKNFKNIFVDLLIDLFIICSLFSRYIPQRGEKKEYKTGVKQHSSRQKRIIQKNEK